MHAACHAQPAESTGDSSRILPFSGALLQISKVSPPRSPEPGAWRVFRPRPPPFPSVASEIIQSKTMDIAGNTSATRAPGSGSALTGFLVSGFLLALLGAILPAWGNHRE